MMNPHRSASASQAGFTLVEMLVGLAVTVVLILGVLFTFDFTGRVARAQSYVSDLQQSLRVAQDDVVRLVRMAGRGSLPLADPALTPLPQGLALGVRDNVLDNKFIIDSDPATRILPGTDVLTVRGVFGPLYQVNFAGSATFDGDPDNPSGGTLTISNPSPGGAAQDLTAIKNAITSGTPEAILLAAVVDDDIRAVVELVPSGSSIGPNQVVIRFLITGGTRTADYLKLSTGGTFQKSVKNIAYAGILEEHRYYVREEHAIAGDRNSDLMPKLARARFYPGTDTPYNGEASNARLDLADNILDFQVALGFDSSNGGARRDDADNAGTDDEILETDNGLNDDWLFNNTGDDPAALAWQGPPAPALQYVRVTTIARSDRRDPQYQAPLLPNRLEDRSYASGDPLNNYASRMYRWQMLRTVIDLRNL
jgi:prepilin-type N-terminal cleavage/methylation domain-containing protein